jgi:hypothetical protein
VPGPCWRQSRQTGLTCPAGGPPTARGHFLLRSEVFRRAARLEVQQGDRVLAAARARLVPGRPLHLGAGWMARADPSAGAVRVALG